VSHIVIYRSTDGKPGYHQVDDLEAAVAFVETLRNSQGVDDSRIYRMEQINFRFETVYHVRLDGGDAPPPPPPPNSTSSWTTSTPSAYTAPATTVSTTAVGTAAEPAASEVGDEADVDTNGVRRGLFGR
jgi:hypothetical protein